MTANALAEAIEELEAAQDEETLACMAERSTRWRPPHRTVAEATLAEGDLKAASVSCVPHGGLGSVVLNFNVPMVRLTFAQARELYEALEAIVTRRPSTATFAKAGIDGQRRWDEFVRQNEFNPYSRAVVEYAEAWAVEMERRINASSFGPATVADVAEDASQIAALTDRVSGGLTGAQVRLAALELIACWDRGAELRTWCEGRLLGC